MKTVSLKCPHCGAPVNGTNQQEFIKCSYCESTIYIEHPEQPKTVRENTSNMIEAARSAVDSGMYERAYEVYNMILLEDPKNIEAGVYSQILYLKRHISNYAEFNRYECSAKVKSFIAEICAENISDEEKAFILSNLFFLLGDIATDVDLYISGEFDYVDSGDYAEIFSCRYLILDAADKLCELYPDNELFKRIYIGQWTIQLIWIKDKERIKEVREKLKRYNADGMDMLAAEKKPSSKKSCMGCLGILAALFFICLLISSCFGANKSADKMNQDAAIQQPATPIAYNSIQKIFLAINEKTTPEDIEDAIKKSNLEYTHERYSGSHRYRIAFEKEVALQRRGKSGESISVSFEDKGNTFQYAAYYRELGTTAIAIVSGYYYELHEKDNKTPKYYLMKSSGAKNEYIRCTSAEEVIKRSLEKTR
ncbi:MAG: hypothetical protein Q4D07_08105 [Selenomonadaceae bacterium]|nr:hypothetical protein [Selenomonadaceae bacterium]